MTKARRKDLVGQRFGKLTVIAFHSKAPSLHVNWLCSCSCGEEKVIAARALIGGQVSCGCFRGEKLNGMWATREYNSYSAMKERCLSTRHKQYKDYGGRGIRICQRWLSSFHNFYEDMGDRPEATTLDRIDNDGNYEPGNCRWASRKEQEFNKRFRN